MGHVPEFDAEEDITNRHKIFNVMKVRIILSKCQNSILDRSEG
jgi:hypothetical protein